MFYFTIFNVYLTNLIDKLKDKYKLCHKELYKIKNIELFLNLVTVFGADDGTVVK